MSEPSPPNGDLTLGCVQLEIVPGDVEENVDRAVDAIERAATRGADLIGLPEIFTVGYFEFDRYDRTAEPVDGDIIGRIKATATEHDVAVLAGTIVEDLEATSSVQTPHDDGLANTAVLVDRTGTIQLVYRKHHLFGYESRESSLLTPGEQLETADICGLTVGVTTCYDLRFPELYRQLVDLAVELVLVPSAWPYPRVEHWDTLSRARAIENQCYLATINGTGSFEDVNLLGRSTVYDPWGTPLASSGDEPTLVMAKIESKRVEAVRSTFPALRDRR